MCKCDLKDAMCFLTVEEREVALEEINEKIEATDTADLDLTEHPRGLSNLVAGYATRKNNSYLQKHAPMIR